MYKELDSEYLIRQNISYAKKLARRFYNKRSHTQAELADLESAAYLGLCEAASRYDSDKENKFQTYSYLRIVGSMYDYLVANGGFSRTQYNKIEKGITSSNQPTLKVAKDIHELLQFQSLIEEWGIRVEINTRKGSVELMYSEDKLADQKIEDYELSQLLSSALSKLDDVSRKVIMSRYLEGKKLCELAADVPGYSQSQLSRICTKALRELRINLQNTIQ